MKIVNTEGCLCNRCDVPALLFSQKRLVEEWTVMLNAGKDFSLGEHEARVTP